MNVFVFQQVSSGLLCCLIIDFSLFFFSSSKSRTQPCKAYEGWHDMASQALCYKLSCLKCMVHCTLERRWRGSRGSLHPTALFRKKMSTMADCAMNTQELLFAFLKFSHSNLKHAFCFADLLRVFWSRLPCSELCFWKKLLECVGNVYGPNITLNNVLQSEPTAPEMGKDGQVRRGSISGDPAKVMGDVTLYIDIARLMVNERLMHWLWAWSWQSESTQHPSNKNCNIAGSCVVGPMGGRHPNSNSIIPFVRTN